MNRTETLTHTVAQHFTRAIRSHGIRAHRRKRARGAPNRPELARRAALVRPIYSERRARLRGERGEARLRGATRGRGGGRPRGGGRGEGGAVRVAASLGRLKRTPAGALSAAAPSPPLPRCLRQECSIGRDVCVVARPLRRFLYVYVRRKARVPLRRAGP